MRADDVGEPEVEPVLVDVPKRVRLGLKHPAPSPRRPLPPTSSFLLLPLLEDIIPQFGNKEIQEAMSKAFEEHDSRMAAGMKKFEEDTKMVAEAKKKIKLAQSIVVDDIRRIACAAPDASGRSAREIRSKRRDDVRNTTATPLDVSVF